MIPSLRRALARLPRFAQVERFELVQEAFAGVTVEPADLDPDGKHAEVELQLVRASKLNAYADAMSQERRQQRPATTRGCGRTGA